MKDSQNAVDDRLAWILPSNEESMKPNSLPKSIGIPNE